MNEYRWYTLFPASTTVAARSPEEARQYILDTYTVLDLIEESEIEDTTDEVGDPEFLADLDRG
jgi:hypothetical protein